ncbi:unnamed protein product [Urochloa humidicola]
MQWQRHSGSGGGLRVRRWRAAGGCDRQVQPRRRPRHRAIPQEHAQGHAPTRLRADYFADCIWCPHPRTLIQAVSVAPGSMPPSAAVAASTSPFDSPSICVTLTVVSTTAEMDWCCGPPLPHPPPPPPPPPFPNPHERGAVPLAPFPLQPDAPPATGGQAAAARRCLRVPHHGCPMGQGNSG